ncbi:hypothetical protein ILUMI_25206 [Ignelater luminosus]|uniref:RHD domain-containing protein n=1 Tax=Ignelater luminosus TaxID=2038154 RepID=A0A8K0CC63_IGNLU|nr:hypothetical protein ILUMI_25206 [Ignelater luminosus]
MMDDHGLGLTEGAGLTGMRDDNINISDVIEVIETDPDFNRSNPGCTMFNGGGEISQTMPTMAPVRQKPVVKITEQPASKALRFRYECEGRSAGSIPGVSSTPENKTFPAIQIAGYQGRAVVVVSCVTKDAPHRPHPHNLVGREGCKKGVCTLEVSPETMSVTFSNLGIQCVKKKDIEAALKVREEIRVDPFRTGFAHRNQPTSIDLNAVRLCFQVFLEGEQRGKFTVPLTPVVSEPIYDKKAMCDLVIVKLSDCVSSVNGGTKDIILLCEKVAKEDIQIRFYEEKDGRVEWEGFGDFQPSQVHKQTAIWFRAPRYKTLDVTEPVKVFIQLRRPSDGATSEPLPFEFLPLDSDETLRRKIPKFDRTHKAQIQKLDMNRLPPTYSLNIPQDSIKMEPRDTTPSPYDGQIHGGISPMYTPNMTALSPQGQYHVRVDPLGHTPPPPDLQGRNIYNPNAGLNVLPSINEVLPRWEIPNVTNVVNVIDAQNDLGVCGPTAMNIDTPNNISNLLDLDSQELKQINLNSGELPTFDANILSETLCNNLSFSDIGMPRQENMTDSLTRLANNTIDSIYQLNNMYRPNEDNK